ncbi:MAG: tRNA lysidine(34) synthetase TilS [Bacillota bacterium]
MLERVREAIHRGAMLRHGDRVIVAVSGGPDSVALLHLLHRMAPEWALSLHVFHLDHGLRGEASAADAAYVTDLAKSLGLPVTVVTLSPGELKRESGSVQANARRRRYQEIYALATRIQATRVAMGHNRDDQAETVLMRLLRGAGLKGLASIPPVREEEGLTIIRPLLTISRYEIEGYCVEHKLFPRFDASNARADYLRNRIRLELLPMLSREYNPAIAANLAQLAAVVREEDDLLEQQAREAFSRCRIEDSGTAVVLDGARLLTEPLALARRVVRIVGRQLAGPEVDLGLPAVTRVLDAAARNDGTHTVDLPAGLRLTVEYGRCRFEGPTVERGEVGADDIWPVAPQGVTLIPELGFVIRAETLTDPQVANQGWAPSTPEDLWLDADRLAGPLAIRFRRPGDRLWPTGMEGSKKLQDILVDAKVPRSMRTRLPLLVAGDEVICLIGIRLDRRFLAGPTARCVIRLRILQKPPDLDPDTV